MSRLKQYTALVCWFQASSRDSINSEIDFHIQFFQLLEFGCKVWNISCPMISSWTQSNLDFLQNPLSFSLQLSPPLKTFDQTTNPEKHSIIR